MNLGQVAFLALLFRTINFQMVKNIIESPQNLNQESTTETFRVDYSSSLNQIEEYSIWGWFKYDGNTKLLNNILAMYSLKQSNLQRQQLGMEKNQDHPDCPINQEMLQVNPSLILKKEIKENPNCFNYTAKNFQYFQPDTEILYVNFERSQDENQFSIIFYIQQGINEEQKSVMVMESFENMQFIENSWIYFSISVDYKQQNCSLFMEDFNTVQSFQNYKKIKINSNDFTIQPIFEIDLLSKKQNLYFEQNGVLSGVIGFVSVIDIYIENVQDLWLLNLTDNQLDYQGILYESFFDIRDKTDLIKNTGKYQGKYHITNNFEPLYQQSNETYGVQIYESSIFNLGNFDFDQVSQTHSFMFYFDVIVDNYQKDFYLLRRGQDQKAGYMEIKFILQSSGFLIQLKLVGNGDIVEWKSPFNIVQNKRIKFFIGISLSLSQSLKIIYLDDQNQHVIQTLSNNFWYNFMPSQLKLFDNKQEEQKQQDDQPLLKIYRFVVMNQSSSAVFTRMITNTKNKNLKDFFKDCQFILSGYQQANGCINCKNSVANLQKQCIKHCPIDYINFQNGTCLSCHSSNCQDYPLTKFQIKQYDDDSFILEPTRTIDSDMSLIYDNLFTVFIDDMQKNQNQFDYSTSIIENQNIRLDFEFKKNLQSSKLNIHGNDPYISTVYDINRNLVSRQIDVLNLENICYVSSGKNIFLKLLASLNLFMFFSMFLILLVFQFLKIRKVLDRFVLWRMLFNWYMQLQLITFFTLLGTNLPCCLFKYLDLFYDTFVTWNYLLRPSLNTTYNQNELYTNVIQQKSPEQRQFILEGVKPQFLHNSGLIFIIQVFIVGLYLIILLLRKISVRKRYFLNKIADNFKYRILIISNTIFIIHTTVFSAISIRQTYFSHFYFVANFLISIVYMVLALVLILFIAIAIKVPRHNQEVILRKFQLVLVGYDNTQKLNIFELYLMMLYLLISISIGFLFDQIIAQNVMIAFCLLILIISTILIKPYQRKIQQRTQIVSYCFLLFAFVFLFIMSVNESNGCTYCGDREFSFCFLVAIPMFLAQTTHFVSMVYSIIKQLKQNTPKQSKIFSNEKITIKTPAKPKAKNKLEKTITDENLLMSERDLEKKQNLESIVSKQESINELIENLKKETIKSFNEDQAIQFKVDEMTNKTFSSEDLESEMFQENLHDLEETIDLYQDTDIINMSEKTPALQPEVKKEDQKVSFRSVKKEEEIQQDKLAYKDSENQNLNKILQEQKDKQSILDSNMSGDFSKKSARDTLEVKNNQQEQKRSNSKKTINSKTSNVSGKSKRSQRQNQRSQRSTNTALLSEKKRAQRYEKREETFATNLNQFVSVQTQNPFSVVQKNYRVKRLKFFFNDPDDQKLRSFLTLDAIAKFKKSKTEKDQEKYINFMSEILKEENIDMHFRRVFTQDTKIKKHMQGLTFQQQQGQDMYLQKKQKTFGGFIYRACFVTDTSFGQIGKEKNTKPQYFIENDCRMQTQDQVKKLREDKEHKKTVFPWADKKECKDYKYRLQFTNLQSKKISCVYFKDKDQCQNLKNLIIFQKKKHKDPYFQKKASVFVNNWRVKQAGFLYGKILRRFFSSADSIQEINNHNTFLAQRLNEFQQQQGEQLEEIPEEYNNDQENVQVIDFQNQNPSYIKKQQAINLDQSQSLFVSMIDKISYRRIDTSQKKIQFDIKKTNINFKVSDEIIQGLKFQIFKNSLPNDLNNDFKEKIIKSSLVLVRLKNINLQYKDQKSRENSLFKISIDQKENQQNYVKGMSVLSQNGKNVVQCDVSRVVNLNVLKEFKISIINEKNNNQILQQSIDVFQQINSFDYSNFLTINVDCNENNDYQNIQLFMQLIVVPKNLEISHLLLPSFIIQNNLNSFGELIEKTYNYEDFHDIFYSEQVVAYFHQISNNYELLASLYNPIQYESLKQQLNFCLYINYQQQSSFVIDLIELLFKEEFTLENIFENVGFDDTNTNTQSQVVKRINSGCSSYERSFISMIIIQQFSFLKKSSNNSLKYSIVEITNIENQINQFLIKKAYLTAQEKFRFFKLVLEIYNDFQNYELEGRQIRVYFSVNYLDLIYNAMINNFNLKDQQIKKIACSDIYVSIDFTQYSHNQILIHFNKILLFIKYMFKFLMPENFESYIQNCIVIDQHILQFLMTNFSQVQNQSFIVLQDFKKIFSLVFYQKYPDIISIMDALNITLFNYFDIMLILSALIYIKKDIEQISDKNKLDFQSLLYNAFNNPKELIEIQIKLYQKLQQENYFFNQLQKINSISNIQLQKETIFQKLKEDVYNLEITEQEIKAIFEKNILQSQNFNINIKQMFTIIENIQQPIINDYLNQQTNPYFEILDDFDEFINLLEQNDSINENFMLELILNGIDGKFARKLNKKQQNDDLSQICKYDADMLGKIFNFQKDNIEIFNEILDSLKLMYQQDQLPILDVLIIIILQKFEQADQNRIIIEMFQQITQKFLINSQNQIAIEFYLHAKKLIYLFSFQNFNYLQEANKIRQSQQKKLDCISEATLFIQNQCIDIKNLCNSEFIGFKFSTGKYGMHFDSNFCKQLSLIFEDLVRKEAIDIKQRDQKFNINIIRCVYQVKSYFNIQFKVIFGEEIKILCLQHEPIYFKQILSDQGLVDVEYIEQDLQHLSINAFCKQYDLERSLDLKKLNFEVVFESMNSEFLKVSAQFDEDQHLQIYNRITTWEYQKSETEQEDLMNLEFEDLQIKVPYFFLFMKTGYFVKYLQQLVVSQIKTENIIGFIKLNTDRYQILNEKDKLIEADTMMISIKNFQEKIENEGIFKLKISYKY